MVFFFVPRGSTNERRIHMFMGRDKFENEDLIKYGFPEDVWFHVDNLSSAHVYLRLPAGMDWTEIPEETLEDCAQLVKQNSIQGCKQNNVDIVYTPWSNLKKTNAMEIGQIGFHNAKLVKKLFVERKNNDIINRLNKTRTEPQVDLRAEREAYDKQMQMERKAQKRQMEQQRTEEARQHKAEQEIKEYRVLMDKDHMEATNKKMEQYENNYVGYEDDFM